MANQKILVVDDDPKTVELIRLYLEKEHYHVLTAYDGGDALEKIRERQPDLVILDLMLPKISGLDICRIVSMEKKVPMIMLTAKSTEDDILLGLDLGADDYITKPFSPKTANGPNAGCLTSNPAAECLCKTVLIFGELELDQIRHEVRLRQKVLPLTPREFQLLETMALEPGRAFSRLELLERVFGFDYHGLDRTVDAHIMNLRKKLDLGIKDQHEFVQTVYGIGYRFVESSSGLALDFRCSGIDAMLESLRGRLILLTSIALLTTGGLALILISSAIENTFISYVTEQEVARNSRVEGLPVDSPRDALRLL